MAFIRNTDKFIEGSKLFFSNERAKAAVQSDLDQLSSEDSAIKLRLDVIEGSGAGSISKAQADAQAYADQKVAALVNSAPEVLDTLKELSDALGGDQNFAATVAGQIGAVDAKVDQEILDRQAADSALSLRLNVLEADPVTKTYVDSQISAEQLARNSAIAFEEAARIAADNAEAVARQAEDAKKVNKAGDTMTGELILEAGLRTLNPINGFDSSGEQTVTISPEHAEFNLRRENFQTSITPNYAFFTEIDTEGSGSWKGVTFIEVGQISLSDATLNPSMPVDPAHVTTKAYVDAGDALLSSRIDALESAPGPDVDKAYVDAQVSSLQSEALAFVKLDGSRVMSGNLDFGQNFQLSEFTIVLSEAKEFYLNFNKDSTGESADTPSVMYEAGSHTFVLADLGLSFEPENFNIYSNDGENLGYWSQPTGAVSNVSYLSIPGSGGHRIINLADPVQNSDAATKAYVDAQDSALDGRIITAEGNIAGIIGSLDYVSNYAQTALLKLDGTSEMRWHLNLGGPIAPLTQITLQLAQPKELYFSFENATTFQGLSSEAVMYEAGQHVINVADFGLSFHPETFSLMNMSGDVLGSWSESSGVVSNDPDLSFSVTIGAPTLLHKVINLAEPTASSDAATKGYVDGQVSGIQGQIDTEKGRIDAILSAADADKDSFAEIVQLINSVDTSNDSAFASYVLSNDAALAQEVSDRQAGDSALSSRLDVLEQDPTTKTYVDGVQSALDARIDSLELDSVTKAYVDSSKLAENIQTISASTSVSSSSTTQIFFCNVSGGSVTVTLPSATAVVPGRKFVVKDTGSSSPSGNSIVVAAQAGQTVDGQSSFEMKMPFEAAQFVSDGSQWFVM